MERLSSRLAALLEEPAGRGLEPEIVVVQSLGMRRWLSLELAQRQGVCANVRFPFPQGFLEEVFERRSRGAGSQVCRREIMTWRLMALLPELIDRFQQAPGSNQTGPARMLDTISFRSNADVIP